VTTVITGASRGIGRATALELARRGRPLALIGRKSPGLDDTAESARRAGVRVETFACELEQPEQIEIAAERILDRHGAPDAVIHNAAVIHRAPVEELSNADWNRQIDVNLRAPFLLTRALLPEMKRSRKGRFVFVSSISGTVGTPLSSAYNASKWGVIGFMKSLAEELKDSGVMAVAILPGSVDTKMLDGSGFVPRINADEVAKTIVHYANEASLAHNGGVVEMFGV
jgi:3-oxoacyl-[acyl-carrier protein] reductase